MRGIVVAKAAAHLTLIEQANRQFNLTRITDPREAAIKHLKKASECCQKNDLVGKGVSVGKAHDIVNELANTLDFAVGYRDLRKTVPRHSH